MFKTYKSSKDAYITDQLVRNKRCTRANTGKAGTINLFKLYGVTQTADVDNIELSRGLIKFDIEQLKVDYSNNKFDVTDPTFKCFLQLFDVYGGQTTPAEYHVDVCPLAKEFTEGIGSDVVQYRDIDVANFLSASRTTPWTLSGANQKGSIGDSNIDVYTSSSFGSLISSQYFKDGTEDLYVDVTNVISATLTNQLPDYGFRISFNDQEESDTYTRFVKRFATKDAHDVSRHPRLIVKYDDSIRMDNSRLAFDTVNQVILYNKVRNTLTSIKSGSISITGSNCILLEAWISASNYSVVVTGSQYKNSPGIYYAPLEISSQNQYFSQVISDNKAPFLLKWKSLDGTVVYHSSSNEISLSSKTDTNILNNQYYVTGLISSECTVDEIVRVRVHIEDINTPYIKYVKVPYITPSIFPDAVYYAVRNSYTNETVLPFDDIHGSTRLSNDAQTLWFDLDMSNFHHGVEYEIDIMIVENNLKKYYRNVASKFKVIAKQ